jgi:hypothetical protein
MLIYDESKKDEYCGCMQPPFYTTTFEDYKIIGTDMTLGRFGYVNIIKCNKCSNLWLHYMVEYESYSNSGRWFRGFIKEEEMADITPENAVDFLNKLDWYFYGGSYFRLTIGKTGKGNVCVDN